MNSVPEGAWRLSGSPEITCIRTYERCLYLAVVLDLFSR